VIVVSHRPSALVALNMALVMNQGRAIAFGARDEVFARVANPAARTTTAVPTPAPEAAHSPAKTMQSLALTGTRR